MNNIKTRIIQVFTYTLYTVALFSPLALKILSVYLPVLVVFTAIFVVAMILGLKVMIENNEGLGNIITVEKDRPQLFRCPVFYINLATLVVYSIIGNFYIASLMLTITILQCVAYQLGNLALVVDKRLTSRKN